MAFKLENFGAEIANAKGTLGGLCYYRYFNEENNDLTTSGYFPPNLGLEVGDRIRVIPSVKTDPDEIYIVTSTANRTVVVKQVDTDGVVDSVNGKTGTVVLDASDVGALPNSTVIPEAIQVSTMPTASATEEGKIYQFTGTTDANYINGYFYKCVSDGQNPATYSWTAVEVQASSGGLPSQTGNAGKFLTTDGTDASWSDKPLVNQSTGPYSVSIKGGEYSKYTGVLIGNSYAGTGRFTTNGVYCIGASISGNSDISGQFIAIKPEYTINYSLKPGSDSVCIGGWASGTYSAVFARGTASGEQSTVINSINGTASGTRSIIIGSNTSATAEGAIQIGGASQARINSDANTVKFGNQNGNFEIMNANGNLPADRLASTTGLADGNYRLRLTMASGVPTLSWVAE